MEEKEFRQRVMPLQCKMYTIALRLGMAPDDAVDAVQETLLKLWRARGGIPEQDAGLNAYCMTALRNECISFLRRRKEIYSLDDIDGKELKTHPGVHSFESEEEKNRIKQFIESLPEGQRIVIKLSSYDGYEIQEISEATGYSLSNVRQLLSRGRKRLRVLLNEANCR